MDPGYYKSRAVIIYCKGAVSRGLQRLLKDFGTIYDYRTFRIQNGTSVPGPPNTVIAIFNSPNPVNMVLDASKANTDGSFWKSHSITAHPLDGNNKRIDNFFLEKVFPRLTSKSTGEPRGTNGPPRPDKRKALRLDFEDSRCPAKRPRIETQERTVRDAAATNNSVPIHNSPRTSSRTPDSPEWMRARITRLESELDSVKAARDMAVSEQEVLRTAHQTEQRARREVLSQKSALEAALSRKEAEQYRFHSDIEALFAQKTALCDDVDKLRERLAAAEDRLILAQPSSEHCMQCDVRTKTLEVELETARDQAHKLQLQKSRLEECEVNPSAHELEDARGRIKKLKSKIKELKTDLAQTHEQLGSAQQSLESMERKRSSSRRKYESTKAKLGTYKARLENEQNLLMKLRDTLTPAAYHSLGATHETLGAFLSAMGLPPVSEEENAGPKEESD
ncbi:unnamed protein product [Rhizoctonia solani]|uniref:Uncharacterized protein n=1 Tax=Rhizoctonia solani TaxID=456999 RepID=A0A8H3DIS0_9AGAM|nr:unnamed protein product [Rhizoctonia solani]